MERRRHLLPVEACGASFVACNVFRWFASIAPTFITCVVSWCGGESGVFNEKKHVAVRKKTSAAKATMRPRLRPYRGCPEHPVILRGAVILTRFRLLP